MKRTLISLGNLGWRPAISNTILFQLQIVRKLKLGFNTDQEKKGN